MWNGIPKEQEESNWHLIRFFYENRPNEDYVDIALLWRPENDCWVQHTLGTGIIIMKPRDFAEWDVSNTKPPVYRGLLKSEVGPCLD